MYVQERQEGYIYYYITKTKQIMLTMESSRLRGWVGVCHVIEGAKEACVVYKKQK